MSDDSADDTNAGGESSAREIYERYAVCLLRFAERQISQRLGRRFDAEDIVQSVFRTYFRRRQNGEFSTDAADSLWQLLVHITANKIRRQAKFHTRQRRDIRSEVYADGCESDVELFARLPGPDSVEALLDTLDEALHGLNAQQAEIVCLTLQGYSASEVALRVNLSRTTVWRVLQRVRVRVNRRQRADLVK